MIVIPTPSRTPQRGGKGAKMADYIPASDSLFDEWARNFSETCGTHVAELGLSPQDMMSISSAYMEWQSAYVSHQNARNAARGATEDKDEERDDAEELFRRFTRVIQARPETTDSLREALGITVPDRTKTLLAAQMVLANEPPLLLVDHSLRGQTTIHFGPNPSNERENALPQGMRGGKIWYHIGGLPETEDEWRWLADDTNSPYTHIIGGAEAVTIAYRAQYFDRRMRLGPFGDPVVVTISV